jgi:hypothetical protein
LSAALDSFTISDGVFLDAQWSTATIADTTSGGMTVNAFQVLSGGNPGAYRQVDMSGTGGTGHFSVAHVFAPAAWNPATQGAITFLDYSNDLAAPSFGQGTDSPPFLPLVLQNGSYYEPFANGPSSAAWHTFPAAGILASQFNLSHPDGTADFSAHSDFSASGGPIKFGFATVAQASPTIGGIDNWQFTVHFTDAPEPSSLWLAAGALAAAVAWRGRRSLWSLALIALWLSPPPSLSGQTPARNVSSTPTAPTRWCAPPDIAAPSAATIAIATADRPIAAQRASPG